MNFLRGVMGGQSAGPQHTEAETIQKLCDRVASSTLLDDRRNAVRALKSLSKKYRLEVGSQAMEHLTRVLQTDRSDSEIIGYALDTLYNIISNDEEEVEENSTRQSEDLGSQFTEIFIKQQENVTLLLSLLEEFDFHVRWPGVKLLTALLKHLGPQVQQIILVSPMGVSRLMDLLADSREVIRNDALTRSNGAIQKIVAFENAFERLLDIITEEGNSDGGIVVEDCLILLQNLLKNNNSNQNFFKEGSYIQRMKPWFEVGDENSGWSAQKVTNLHLMLQLVRVLVSPTNPPGATSSCQKAMFQCGLLQQLCTILMATGVPADILTETINTVSEVIRGCQVNQDYFASVNAPSNPPRPAIVVLLMSMVNERQPFVLRCAVLYCFQCFLYKNQKGQGEIVSTLLPSTIDATGNSVSAGQLLCGGLFSTDSLSNWCAAVALAHALQENSTQKELKSNQEFLRSQLAEKDSLIENLKSSQTSRDTNEATASARDSEQIAELKQELATLKSQLNSKSVEITKLQTEKQELLQKIEAFSQSVPVPGESETVVAAKATDVEGRLSALLQETKELKNEIKALSEERTAIKEQLDSSNSTIVILQNEKNQLEVNITDSKKEQDDLLVLLADQDQKILSLKHKLKELGHPDEEEDELESIDQDDEDDEDEVDNNQGDN
ncbi:USO1 vesicle transport factor [Phyllostomus discolor]|uniref:USO1 vesicle transport factor n=1 Tax=Phyllostomus discolor TaxID=89673 RepID=A0A834EY87_9CHIR|nr:USO1 vesicle transport factor [Phyllostomus discolor]